MLADASLGLALGERVRLGKESYTVVGITRGMVSSGGDGLASVTSRDAQAIQFDEPGEAARLEREARGARALAGDFGRTQPAVLERAAGPAATIAALPGPAISAVIARLAPGADTTAVLRTLRGWSDVAVYAAAEQEDLLLKGSVDRARRQILLFRVLLTIISAVIMALIIYTLTLEKLHPIALLKLIGAPNHTIIGLILQQSLIKGALAYGIGYVIGQRLFPLFPRRVLVTGDDLLRLAGIVLLISVAGSSSVAAPPSSGAPSPSRIRPRNTAASPADSSSTSCTNASACKWGSPIPALTSSRQTATGWHRNGWPSLRRACPWASKAIRVALTSRQGSVLWVFMTFLLDTGK